MATGQPGFQVLPVICDRVAASMAAALQANGAAGPLVDDGVPDGCGDVVDVRTLPGVVAHPAPRTATRTQMIFDHVRRTVGHTPDTNLSVSPYQDVETKDPLQKMRRRLGSIAAIPKGGAVPDQEEDLDGLASRVQDVLDAADLTAFAELLDPDVRWGAPGDDEWGCHNRDQVIAWYNRARGQGMAGRVTEVVVGDGALLVGLEVTGTGEAEEAGGAAERWQVLRVRDGRVFDIRGYPDRSEAATQAGIEG